MKTNTNTLRRALETFAKTGKITLTASALMALALSAPVKAETKEFADVQYITGDVTVSADDAYKYNTSGNIADPMPNDQIGEGAGMVFDNGTLTVKGTVDVNGALHSGTANGSVSNIVVDGGTLNAAGAYTARHKGSVSNLTIANGGTISLTDSFYFACRGEGTANITNGKLIITNDSESINPSLHIAANRGVGGSEWRDNAVGTFTVGKGGEVIVENSISLGRYGSVETTELTKGILNVVDGGYVKAANIAMPAGVTDNIANKDYAYGEINVSGTGSLLEVTKNIQMDKGSGVLTVENGGTITAGSIIHVNNKIINVNQGGTLNVGNFSQVNANDTARINIAGGNMNVSGTLALNASGSDGIYITAGLLNLQNTSTLAGTGSLNISGGELRAKDNTLNYSGKTLNYSGGTLPETLNLTNTALNISANSWNVTSVNDTNGSTLNVAFTPDGTGTVLGSTTFTGFETEDVTLKFAEGVNNQRLTSYAMTADGKITYETAAAKNLVLKRGTDVLESDTLSGFASLQTGDVIDMTANVTEKTPVLLPVGDMTLRSNSAGTRTMTIQNGNLFFFEGTGSLTAENIKFTGGTGLLSGEGRYGGAIYADSKSTFTLNGGIFEKNSALGSVYNKSLGGVLCGENAQITGVEFKSNAAGYGGAIYANTSVDIADSSFVGNSASITNSLGYSKGNGGAVYSPSVTVSNSSFENNTAGTSGGAVYGTEVHLKDTHFEGNIAGDMTVDGSTTSGSYGGAVYVGSQGGSLSGTNTFIGNQAESGGGALYVRSQYDGYKVDKTQFVISGNNTFIDNHGGAEDFNGTNAGAILLAGSSELVFEGADSTAVFKGNTGGSSNKPNDILGSGYNNVTIKDGGNYVFEGGISLDSQRLNGNGEYIDGTLTIGQAGQNGAPVVTFGGDSVNKFTSLAVTNDSVVTFQDGAKLTIVNGGTVDGATLNLEGNVDFTGKLTMANTTANFNADPTVNGFTTLNADQFSGTVNVDLNAFTVGAMDGDTVTLINGGKAGTVNIPNKDHMTLTEDTDKTAVKITTDKDGQFGSAPLANSKLVGIDFEEGQTSMTVKDFSLIVDGVNSEINLQDFADWLGEETGLETAVGTGYVSVRLDSPFEIMSTDSFIWDFTGFDGAASLQFVTANIMDNTVPEPTTWALLVLGGLGVFGVARKNRKAKK